MVQAVPDILAKIVDTKRAELALLAAHRHLAAWVAPSNRPAVDGAFAWGSGYSASGNALVDLGRRLFFDTRFSVTDRRASAAPCAKRWLL